MSKSKLTPSRWLLVLALSLSYVVLPLAAAAGTSVGGTYGKLPLPFEANRGQTHGTVKFLTRGAGYSLYLTPTEAVLVLVRPDQVAKSGSRSPLERFDPKPQSKHVALRMRLVGASLAPGLSGREELPGKANYFIGRDPEKWRVNVPTYAKVEYQNVYPGIDVFYYGNQRQLEHDFVVAPGADPGKILLNFQGAENLELDTRGDLVVHTAAGEVRLKRPVVYQEIDGSRREIDGAFSLKNANQVGFDVAAYDQSRPLIIDPVLAYSTYLGGSVPANNGNEGLGIAVDTAGNAYVAGDTDATNFPTTSGAFQTASTAGPGGTCVFVTKLNPTGTALVYSTYLCGGLDVGTGIAVDAAGSAYVTGFTGSSTFPTTAGAFQKTAPNPSQSNWNAFVTKLNPTGSALVYSTYLGGSSNDKAYGIALDSAGNAYVTGWTISVDFPTTLGAFQPVLGGPPATGINLADYTEAGGPDAFVTKLNPSGSALVYSTYLGGIKTDIGYAIAVDASGNAYVTGKTGGSLVSEQFGACLQAVECNFNNFPTTPGAFQPTFAAAPSSWPYVTYDSFVTKLNASGSALVYSTYLGGSGSDAGLAIAIDNSLNAYITGSTTSTDFPTTAGTFQQTPPNSGGFPYSFVSKLDATGSTLVYSTYLGGGGELDGNGIAVDTAGEAYVTGFVDPDTHGLQNLPMVNAIQSTTNSLSTIFVVKFNSTGAALVYSTYFGGSQAGQGNGIALDPAGNAYVTGSTFSNDFPTTAGAFQQAYPGQTAACCVSAFVFEIAQ